MSLIVPSRLPNGARAWLDAETIEFTKRLTELDPRLALVQHSDGRWSIWRVGEDGSEHMIARSKPGAKLDPQVIDMLRQGDTRRRSAGQIVDKMIAENERVRVQKEERTQENLAEAAEKALSVAWRGRLPRKGEGIE